MPPRTRAVAQDEEAQLKAATTIEPLALEEEYIRLPGDLSYWNAKYANALERELRANMARKIKYADLEVSIRSDPNHGKLTVGQVDALVLMNVEFQAVWEEEVAAQADKARAIGAVDSIRAKKDMLISLGAHMRQEMDADPEVRASMAAVREARLDGLRSKASRKVVASKDDSE